jgi:hypothetical protein
MHALFVKVWLINYRGDLHLLGKIVKLIITIEFMFIHVQASILTYAYAFIHDCWRKWRQWSLEFSRRPCNRRCHLMENKRPGNKTLSFWSTRTINHLLSWKASPGAFTPCGLQISTLYPFMFDALCYRSCLKPLMHIYYSIFLDYHEISCYPVKSSIGIYA